MRKATSGAKAASTPRRARTRSPTRSSFRRRTSTTNLLVVGAVSASHVAFASLRMEVNFMAMGDAAGAAAAIAARNDIDVGAVPC